MYYDYFGLSQPPFKITPDTSLFFSGGNRGAILNALIYAIVSGEGIVKLVGEVGSGKTMLCRMLEKELPENIEIVYLANPSLSPDNILHAIAFELHLKIKPDDTRLKVMNSLQNYLLERHAENKQVIVFLEEAQSMPIATLEEIRLLSNLETAQNKLLQIIIFGQPELDSMLSKQEIRQLKERITYSFYLVPLQQDEIKDYINARLCSCRYRSVELFNEKAIKAIAKYSNGLLRRINILADKAMLASYAANMTTVTEKHVKLAAQETEFIGKQKLPFLYLSLVIFSIVAIVITTFTLIQSFNWSPISANGIELVNKSYNEMSVHKNSETNQNKSDSLGLVEEMDKVTDFFSQQPINDKNNGIGNKTEVPEFAIPEWQKLDNEVVIYSEQFKQAKTQPPGQTADLLEIRDLSGSVSGHNDELALLKQLKLTILPSYDRIH